MTVLSEESKITYIGSSSQTLYPIPFEFIKNDNIKVSVYDSNDEFLEDWTYSTQYVIQDNNVKVLAGYEIDNTKKMLVKRTVDYIQDNKYREGGDFPAKSTETSFDKTTMMVQQLQEEVNRCPKVNQIYNINVSLPAPNAGKALIWNAEDNGFKNSTVDVDVLEEVTRQYRDEAEVARDRAITAETNAKASENAAKSSADFAASTVNGFDTHANERQAQFDANAVEKQAAVDASAETARKWAVGTRSEQPAGSSKYWAEYAKSVTAGTLNETQITNCITEIPQDIKLELVSGVLKLKAGSKVYKANGESVMISGDLVVSQAGTNRGAFACYRSDNNTVYTLTAPNMFSGVTAPASPLITTTWLDTKAKDVKVYDGTQWVGGVSLPLCTFDNQDGKVTAVGQIFNGFGYIGSTAFILPGVKGLAPDGRNEDGSLKNFEVQVHDLRFRSITWDCSKGQELFLGYDSGVMNPGFVSTGGLWRYFEKSTEPSSPEKYDIWYNPDANIMKRYSTDSWRDIRIAYLGKWFSESISPYRVTELKTKPTFCAVDYNDYAADIQKCKLIAHENDRYIPCTGAATVVLQDTYEILSLSIENNTTITFDRSQLSFPKYWATFQLRFLFPNGAKTVSIIPTQLVINGNVPDFSDGKSHWVVIRFARDSTANLILSDAGTEG